MDILTHFRTIEELTKTLSREQSVLSEMFEKRKFPSKFFLCLDERAFFLIPQNIELRLAKGSLKRYDNPYAMYRYLHSDFSDLHSLISIINKYHRGYDQEGYIDGNKHL